MFSELYKDVAIGHWLVWSLGETAGEGSEYGWKPWTQGNAPFIIFCLQRIKKGKRVGRRNVT